MKTNQTTFLKLCLADALIKLMASQDYAEINIYKICEKAQVGRTTFYRHFGSKNSKEDLLRFKITYEWQRYDKAHINDFGKDKTVTLLHFVYENRQLFITLNNNGLIDIVICLLEYLLSSEYSDDKNSSYLKYYFIYGLFGVINKWAQYGFDETPEQLLQHVADTIINR